MSRFITPLIFPDVMIVITVVEKLCHTNIDGQGSSEVETMRCVKCMEGMDRMRCWPKFNAELTLSKHKYKIKHRLQILTV